MNRVLKFRAWDTRKGAGKMILMDADSIGPGDLEEEKDWRVMQFTGLCDQRGGEIWEGDIVKIGIDGKEDIYTVCEYFPDAFFHLKGKENQSFSVRFGGSAVHTFEVVGNIYANPELLEVQ